MINVTLPALGEDIDKAVIAAWNYRVGDYVNEGEDIVELVTDKAVFNVTANAAGKITRIMFKEGEEAQIGAVLAVIEPAAKVSSF